MKCEALDFVSPVCPEPINGLELDSEATQEEFSQVEEDCDDEKASKGRRGGRQKRPEKPPYSYISLIAMAIQVKLRNLN